MACSAIIEEPSDVEDILCAEVNDVSIYIHAYGMQITKSDVIDVLLTLKDVLSQTWILDLGASFHITPSKECFTTFHASNHGHVYL